MSVCYINLIEGIQQTKMDKEVLKSVMASLKQEQEIKLNFISQFSSLNGTYKVLKIYKGKGKGGSLGMELMNTSNGSILKSIDITGKDGSVKAHGLGTPVSEYILNVSVDEVLHGARSEADMPRAFPRNEEAGKEMRNLLKPLVGRTTPTKLKIKSTVAPEFTGTWLVENAKLNPGRGGQVSLTLVSTTDPNKKMDLWSYRHGLIIEELEEITEEN